VQLTFRSRRPGFAAQHRETVAAVIERGDRAFFLAGSCGLELFNNLQLPPELERRCTLLCYGPVARRRPHHASTIIVQGTLDVFSRFWFRYASARVPCGHLGYLRAPGFLRICQQHLAQLTPTPCTSTFA
jgi:hypothetical protein